MVEDQAIQTKSEFLLRLSVVEQELARYKRRIDATDLQSGRSWDHLMTLESQFFHIAGEMDYIRRRRTALKATFARRRYRASVFGLVFLTPEPAQHSLAASLSIRCGLRRLL